MDASRPRKGITSRHWLVLFLACAIVFGNYYCYDIPAALNVPLREWLGVSYETFQWQLNLLYSVYSLPNIFLPLLGGFLVDRLGSARMILCFTCVVCVGSVLFAIGISSRHFPLMLLGRVIFGLGGESLEVASAKVTTDWFRRGGLAFAFGINLSSARFASTIQDNLSPRIIHSSSTSRNPSHAAWVGMGMCILSAICGLVLIFMDRPLSRLKSGVAVDAKLLREHLGKNGPILLPNSNNVNHQDVSDSPSLSTHINVYSNSSKLNYGNVVPSVNVEATGHNDQDSGRMHTQLLHKASTTHTGAPSSPSITDPNIIEKAQVISTAVPSISCDESVYNTHSSFVSDAEAEEDEMTISQIRELPRSFWLLCLIAVTFYGSVVPFVHISSDFLQTKWYPGDAETTGSLMAIPDIISAFGSPFFGFLVDKFGHRGHLLPMAGLTVIIAHILLNFTWLHPALPLVLLGAAYALFGSVIWPCVPNLVKPHQTGTAYGFVTVALNFSLALFPLLVAHIRTISTDFVPVGILLMCIALTGVALSIVLNLVVSHDISSNNNDNNNENRSVDALFAADDDIDDDDINDTDQTGNALLGRIDLRASSAGIHRLQMSRTEEIVYHEIEEDDDDDVSVRVVADGVYVPVFHHHHYHHGRRRHRRDTAHRRVHSSDGRVENLEAVPQLTSISILRPNTAENNRIRASARANGLLAPVVVPTSNDSSASQTILSPQSWHG